MRFRKKPVEIDAIKVSDIVRAYNDYDAAAPSRLLPSWFTEAVGSVVIGIYFDRVEIKIPEGVMFGNRGDWIIRGIKGELYPCKADIFAATYEVVDRSGE